MPYVSPLINPGEYVDKVSSLLDEGIAISRGVEKAKREAAEFASRYPADFPLVIELKNITEQFSNHWTTALFRTREAAASLSAWYETFEKVFLTMIASIENAEDAKEAITELNIFRGELPSEKFQLGASPGVESAFTEIESLVVGESDHIIEILESNDWREAVKLLKQALPAVKDGADSIYRALKDYVIKLD